MSVRRAAAADGAPGEASADDGALAEAIALRVAELVAPRPPARLLTVGQVAEMLQVRPEWVYDHAEELGAFRLGGGRGRLRFDPQQVRERLRPPAVAPPVPRRQRPRRATPAARADVALLRVGPKR